MRRLSPRIRILAATASIVAGYVDAVGFLALGGFFVSFMSGNTTRMGVGFATDAHDGKVAVGLIFTFVMGVTLGSLVGGCAGRHRRSVVLALVAALLGGAVVFHAVGFDAPSFAAMALAMGVENALFEHDGDIQVGLTYMTGTLVKAGQHLARALTGGDRWDWIAYLSQWASLAAGALAGAICFPRIGMNALWLPVVILAFLALANARFRQSLA
ncbi:MAG: YoaK family protein [Sphingomonas sp.]